MQLFLIGDAGNSNGCRLQVVFALCFPFCFVPGTGSRKRKRSLSVECSVSSGTGAVIVDGILALHREGYSLREIADSGVVEKPDGDPVSSGMTGNIIRRLGAEPGWRGEWAEGSGRPWETTEVEDKAFVRTVKKCREQEKTTSGKTL